MPDLVAREKQLDQLKAILKSAIGGRLQIVFVTGETGAGKTVLVETFAEQAKRDVPELFTAGSKCGTIAGGHQEPYLPFLHILKAVSTGKKGNAMRDLLRRGLAELAPDWIQLVPVVGGPIAAIISTAQWGGREFGVREQVPDVNSRPMQYTEILRRAAETAPLLLWIDDLHWSDVATVNLISYLAGYAKDTRIMLVITYCPTDIVYWVQGRPHPVKQLVDELKCPPPRCVELPVTAFTLADVEEFLTMSEHCLPPAFVKRLWRNSGGNPLFVKEYVELLDALGQERRDYVLTPDAEIEIPTNVYAVIEQRLSLIEPSLRKVLSYASIQGERFASNILVQLLESPELEILEKLDSLEQVHKLIRESKAQRLVKVGMEYQFIHAVIQQFIYDKLSTGRRGRLHLTTAQVLENLYGERAEQHAPDLAIHFERGDNWERALHYYSQASRHARNFMALDDAQIQTESVQRLSGKLEDEHAVDWQIKALVQFAEIYHKKAEYKAALDSLNRGLELAGSEPTVLLARLLLIRCAVLTSVGKLNEAIQDGQKATQIAQGVDARPEEAYAYNNLGAAYGEQGNIELALECHQRSLDMRRDLGLTYDVTQSLVNLGVGSGMLSYFKRTEGKLDEADRLLDEAEGYLQEALKRRERIDDRYGLGSVYHNLGRVDLERGQVQAAESKFLRALDLWRQVGYPKGVAFVHNDLGGEVYAAQERWDEAGIHLEQSAQIYKSIGANMYLWGNYMSLADVYRNLDRLQDALTAAQKALEWALNPKQEQTAKELLQKIRQTSKADED